MSVTRARRHAAEENRKFAIANTEAMVPDERFTRATDLTGEIEVQTAAVVREELIEVVLPIDRTGHDDEARTCSELHAAQKHWEAFDDETSERFMRQR